jgi:hypothetical protein
MVTATAMPAKGSGGGVELAFGGGGGAAPSMIHLISINACSSVCHLICHFISINLSFGWVSGRLYAVFWPKVGQ